ncbi:MAG: hypothetical protein GQ507_01100 [Dehalococcoidales bacterium]|nr:hypothetical protein [Dehalococcoidales bacterium]
MLKRRISALVSAAVRRRVVLLGVSLSLVLTLSLVACAGPAPASVTVPAPTPTPLPKPIPVPTPTPLLEPTWAPTLAPLQVTDLVVSPAAVKPGEAVVITAAVTNTGDAGDSYTLELRINDTTVLVAEVSVPVGETREVRFSGGEKAPGTYVVILGEASGQFVVVEPGETLLISAPASGTGETLLLSDPAPGSAAPEQSTSSCCGPDDGGGGGGGCGGCGGGSGCGVSSRIETTAPGQSTSSCCG